jgi:hypothetical protein
MVLLTRLSISVTNKKSYWNRPATKNDVFNAMAVFVVAVTVGLIIGFTFLI